jgi:hypothetical protein
MLICKAMKLYFECKTSVTHVQQARTFILCRNYHLLALPSDFDSIKHLSHTFLTPNATKSICIMLTACKTLSWRWLYQGLTAGMLH